MMKTPTCRNADCTENGVAKGDINLNDGEVVHCGVCGEPCELADAAETRPA